jgi:hypothetical protein
MPNFYINGPALSNSTSVFMDAALTECAADGFYSDGIISRQQVDCTLLPAQICPNCAAPCGDVISTLVGPAYFQTDINVSGIFSLTGAIIIKFNPNNIPDGIAVIYDGVAYNRLSSPVDGLHASTNPIGLTYVGNTAYDCGISGNTYSLNEYIYTNGAYVASGSVVSVTVAAGDVSLTTGANPGNCVMVIPKPNSTPSIMTIITASPCTDLLGSILDITCPDTLSNFESSIGQGSSAAACLLPQNQFYYSAPVTGFGGLPNLYDFVFQDAYGQFPLPNGYYSTPARWIRVVNGVVVATGFC